LEGGAGAINGRLHANIVRFSHPDRIALQSAAPKPKGAVRGGQQVPQLYLKTDGSGYGQHDRIQNHLFSDTVAI
jgi:hypothetical protein